MAKVVLTVEGGSHLEIDIPVTKETLGLLRSFCFMAEDLIGQITRLLEQSGAYHYQLQTDEEDPFGLGDT